MPEAGWYSDPNDAALARWHDGTRFTEHTVNMAEHDGPPPPPVAAQPAPPPPPPVAPPRTPAYSYEPLAPVAPVAPTRQTAKADAAAAQARAKAMRPWFKKKRFVIPLVVIALAVVISAASSSSKKDNVTASSGTTVAGETTVSTAKSVNSGSHAAADDVTVTSCENDTYGLLKVGVTILNHSSKTSNYIVSINVTDAAGTKVGDASAATNNVAAGQTAKVDGVGTVSSSSSSQVSCAVASVTRYAS